MAKVVLDASAVLAVLNLEPGGDVVAGRLGEAHIAAPNLTEVVTRLLDKGQSFADACRTLQILSLSVEPVDEAMALAAAAMRSATRKAGLSLGDRLCLALAARMGVPALTSDRSWSKIDIGVEVTVVR